MSEPTVAGIYQQNKRERTEVQRCHRVIENRSLLRLLDRCCRQTPTFLLFLFNKSILIKDLKNYLYWGVSDQHAHIIAMEEGLVFVQIFSLNKCAREVNGNFVARGHARPYEVILSSNWVSQRGENSLLFTISAECPIL